MESIPTLKEDIVAEIYKAFQVDEWAMGFVIGQTHPRGSRARDSPKVGRYQFIFTLSG